MKVVRVVKKVVCKANERDFYIPSEPGTHAHIRSREEESTSRAPESKPYPFN